jgi:hypothetical protein
LKLPALTIGVLLLLPGVALCETHSEVQDAMDYQLPEYTCSKPKVVSENTNVSAPAQSSGSFSFFEGSSNSEVSDVAGNTRKRQERKEKRWKSCIADYKEDLLEDMDELKGSAKHGLTEEQAVAILANMSLVQKVYMTPEGILAEEDSD